MTFLMKVYSLVYFYWYLTFENVNIYERSYAKYNHWEYDTMYYSLGVLKKIGERDECKEKKD